MTAVDTRTATPGGADTGTATPGGADTEDLASFGYEQKLHRSIGSYGSFAAGFSFVSILTTVFQLFSFGFGFGGPSFFWTWPIVFVGQILVALCFSELAARYPISGCIYQWATRMGGAVWGWAAGWLMLVAQIVTVAAAAIAMEIVLPAIWSGFEIVDNPTKNAVLLGSLLLVVTTTINAVGIRVMSIINSVGVTCELVGVVLLCIALFSHAERGPGIVLHTGAGVGHGPGYLWSFIISGLMAAYVMVGFDSAGELSEETRNPRRTAPRTILRALVISGIGGAFMLLATLMAAPSVTDGSLGDPTKGLPYVLTSRLGDTLGRVFLVDVAIAVSVCTLAIQTATTRMIFSMARDRVLPFSDALATVNKRTGAPIRPAVLVGLLTVGLLYVNVGNASVFLALSSVCIMLLYIAYLMVTVPLLARRLKGWPGSVDAGDVSQPGLFSLGRWGVAVNVIAVAWGAFMVVNLGWPRAKVFGTSWYLQYFPQLFLAGAIAGGLLAYGIQRLQRRNPTTALEPSPGLELSPAVGMSPLFTHEVPGGAAWSALIRRGRTVRLTAVGAGANCSMLLFQAGDAVDRMNVPDTLKSQMSARVRAPMVLMSDRGVALASVTGSSLDWHDALCGHSLDVHVARFGPSSYSVDRNEWRQSARSLLVTELNKHGRGGSDLHATVNFFSKVATADDGALTWSPGHGDAGDWVTLRAEVDLLVVLATCPHPMDPTWSPAGVRVDVTPSQPYAADDPSMTFRAESARALEAARMVFA